MQKGAEPRARNLLTQGRPDAGRKWPLKHKTELVMRLFNPLPKTDLAEVGPAEARKRQLEGALMIDVREPDEWDAGHAPGAKLVPLAQLARQLPSLPRDREILFMCRTGRRSALATQMAQRVGLERAANVRGGMVAWNRAGLPVKS